MKQWPSFNGFVQDASLRILNETSKLNAAESETARKLLLRAGDVEQNPGPEVICIDNTDDPS